MKVVLIGSPEQFDYNSYILRERYIPELYSNLIKIAKGSVDNLSITKLPFIGRAFSITLKSMLKSFDNYDIIHNISQDPLFLFNKGSAKLVTTVHLSPGQLDVQATNFKHKLWLNSVIKLSYTSMKTADYLIANSTQTKEDIKKYLGVKSNRIFVTLLGIDNRYLTKTKTQNNKNYKFKVGYLGALVPGKNVLFAINAFKHVDLNDLAFDVYGAATDENYYKQLLDSASRCKNLQFKGYAPENQIVNIYDGFNIFVFPTLYESFGLPIIEAQARGLPVIIYKYGKIPKEVRKYCFEAENPDHMAQIIKDLKENGYNEKRRKKTTEYARSFTWEKCAKETLKIYRRISKK